jgi:tetratricopeptide (TPR) repeat protein
MKLGPFIAGLALVGLVGTAHAETPPSAWDRAKRPEVQDEYQLHLTVRQTWESEDEVVTPNAAVMKEGVNARLLAMLQAAGAATSKNPTLRFDLADAYMKTRQFARAVETYKSAMNEFPDHPQTRRSRFELAIACGHVGDHECEERMYRAVISMSTSPAEIATPALNLAETEMHNRDLRSAIDDYREALRVSGLYPSGPKTPALILWGLSVALDRAGETREADEQVQRALEMAGNRPTVADAVLTSEDVFFFPEYEVHWYQALTYAAAARRAPTPKLRLEYWLEAERHMVQWLTGGEKKKDYWLPIAKSRLATYEKARKEAERGQGKTPRGDDEDEVMLLGPSGSGRPVVPPAPRPPQIRPPPPIPKTGDVHL